jgi:hypothetical protein
MSKYVFPRVTYQATTPNGSSRVFETAAEAMDYITQAKQFNYSAANRKKKLRFTIIKTTKALVHVEENDR